MSDDLQESGARREPSAGASRRLTDPGWLVNADPAQVWAGLDCAVGAEEVLVAAVYRASMRVHKYAAPGVRRQLLALDAARYGAPELAAELAAAEAGDEPDADWRVEWASGSLLGSAHTNASTLSADKRATWATSSLFRPEDISVLGGYYPDEVAVVATAAVGGRTLALVTLTGSNSLRGKLVQVWDVATGRPVGEPLTGHTDTVRAVATAMVDGRPVAVTGSDDKTVRMWDLTTGRPVGAPLTGHTGGVLAVATATVDGRPVAVTGSDDKTVRMWDLTTGRPVGEPLTGHTDTVRAVATAMVDGRPVAITGSDDKTVRMWDLTTGRPVGEPLTGHTGWASAVATATVDGRPVAITGSWDETVRMWDLTTGRPVGEPLTGHTGGVLAVATATVDGRPVAITGGHDKTVRVWDLTTGQPVGEALTGHTSQVRGVATAMVDDHTVAVTGSWDRTVRVWDLATGRQIGVPPARYDEKLGMVVDGRPEALGAMVVNGRPVTFPGSGGEALIGEHVGKPVAGHTEPVRAIATAELDGRLIAVISDGPESVGENVRAWDLNTGRQLWGPVTDRRGASVATAVLDGRPVAVILSGSDEVVRVRDLATGEQLRKFPTNGRGGQALATAVLDGRPVVVTGWPEVWDLTTGEQIHELKGPGDAVLSLAVEALDDRHLGAATGAIDDGEAVTEAKKRTVVVAGVFGDACGSVWAWDLATGEQVGEPFEEAPGWPEGVSTVAVVVVDGRAAAAYGGALEGMCSLTTGEELDEEDYFGRGEAVKALTTTVINGRSVLISGSKNGTVRMWDVAKREQIGRPLAFPMPVSAVEVAPDGRLVVGFGPEIAVLARH
ncbi:MULTISPECIES: WD40 repeat domain-containing protein [unclassified Streptomyces]|uniref:WD40 repeat domain-containing protein n=1 Tax=unclassified Streptomyces TaxID=2593676 RepID=UPI0035DB30A7